MLSSCCFFESVAYEADSNMRRERSQVGLSTCRRFLLLLLPFTFPWLALSQSTVRFLPGFPGPLPFHLETGSVGEREEHQLFYYFVESEGNPKEDPLVLWHTGGPGCSAWSGLVYEIGPLYFEYARYDGSLPTLKLREFSWTKASSIIFLDSPVGTGFSFSSGSKDYILDDLNTSKEVHEFLIKWLLAHPQFLSNPLDISGDSYSGMIVPLVVNEIANGIEAGKEPILNLKVYQSSAGYQKSQPSYISHVLILQGYSLGNPKTDVAIDEGSYVTYAHGMGLIPDEVYEMVKKSCGGVYAFSNNLKCSRDFDEVAANLAGLERAHILEPKCLFVSPKLSEIRHERLLDQNSKELHIPESLPHFGCREYWYVSSYYWANDANVRKALHVRKGTIVEWKRCVDLPYESGSSVVKYHLNITSKGYRALIYSGDHDLIVSFVATLRWIKSLNFSIIDQWRPWTVNGQVAGYTKAYSNNFTFVTVKGAGHTAPEYKPKECLAMLKR